MKNYQRNFYYKKIFIGGCLFGVVCGNIVLPLSLLSEDKNKIIDIPSEFSGVYVVGISSSPMVVSIPLISNFS